MIHRKQTSKRRKATMPAATRPRPRTRAKVKAKHQPPRINNQIGKRVKYFRTKLGFSQRDLQTERVSYAYLSRIEAGTRNPSHKALIEIADKLNAVYTMRLGEDDITALFLLTGDHNARCPFCRREAQ